MSDLCVKIMELLDQYGHENTSNGVDAMLNQWSASKGTYLMPHLSKHPNWDAENYRIVFSSDYDRMFDSDAVTKFCHWWVEEINQTYRYKIIDDTPLCKLTNQRQKMRYNIDRVRVIMDCVKSFTCKIDGVQFDVYQRLFELCRKKEAAWKEKYTHTLNGYLTQEDAREKKMLMEFVSLLSRIEGNVVTEEFANRFAELFPEINCAVGTRVVKIVRRVCVKYGYDKIVDMQPVFDGNGNVLREKDFGYNYQIAALGDGINPLKIKRHTVISLNPLDYLTMSFGNSWASCHTIDKNNERCTDSDHNYHGAYCSGTLSYMLDRSSVIFYTVDESYDGTEFETQDKINRVMFHISENGTVMIQGRVYPDGRDGGDNSLAAQFRAVMQKVWAECNDFNNLWVVKKGTNEIYGFRINNGTHYKDYDNYDDCTISFLKGAEEYPKIRIGHSPICPNCGEEHESEEWLCCESCQEHCDERCEYCGNGINTDYGEYIYCLDTERYYCCEDCANADGVYLCEDDDRWHDEENRVTDCYDGREYHNWIETEDGNCYGNAENAEADGYAKDDNGCWWPEDEVHYDENRDIRFHEDDDTIVTVNDQYFVNAQSAKEAGYLKFDDDWYYEDDMVIDALTGEMIPEDLDGLVEVTDSETIYFRNKENAIAAGYCLNIEGEWVKEVAA